MDYNKSTKMGISPLAQTQNIQHNIGMVTRKMQLPVQTLMQLEMLLFILPYYKLFLVTIMSSKKLKSAKEQ